jgi:4-aminobutyrate aminotransferase-like enzyme
MPLSGVVGRADVMDAAAPGGLGGTYAGNPLAVASARGARHHRRKAAANARRNWATR